MLPKTAEPAASRASYCYHAIVQRIAVGSTHHILRPAAARTQLANRLLVDPS